MLQMILAGAGMLAIGWLVWRLLQKQETRSPDDPDNPSNTYKIHRRAAEDAEGKEVQRH